MASIIWHYGKFLRTDRIEKSRYHQGARLNIRPITTEITTSTVALVIGSINLVAAALVITMSFLKVNNQTETENGTCNDSPNAYEICKKLYLKNIMFSEIWFGIIFGLSGLVGILAGCRPSRCNMVYFLTFSMIVVLTALALLLYSIIWHPVSVELSIVQGLVSFVCILTNQLSVCVMLQNVDTCHNPNRGNVEI